MITMILKGVSGSIYSSSFFIFKTLDVTPKYTSATIKTIAPRIASPRVYAMFPFSCEYPIHETVKKVTKFTFETDIINNHNIFKMFFVSVFMVYSSPFCNIIKSIKSSIDSGVDETYKFVAGGSGHA